MAAAVMAMPKLRLPNDIAVRRYDSTTAPPLASLATTTSNSGAGAGSSSVEEDMIVVAVPTAHAAPRPVTRVTLVQRASNATTARPVSAGRPTLTTAAPAAASNSAGSSLNGGGAGTTTIRRLTPTGARGSAMSAQSGGNAAATTFKRTATNLQMPTPAGSGRSTPQPASRGTSTGSRPTSASGRATTSPAPAAAAPAVAGPSFGARAGNATGPRTGAAAPAAGGSATFQRTGTSAIMMAARPMLAQTARRGASGVLANPSAIQQVPPATLRPSSLTGRVAGSTSTPGTRPLLRSSLHQKGSISSSAGVSEIGVATSAPASRVSSRLSSPHLGIRGPSPTVLAQANSRRASPNVAISRTGSYGRSGSATVTPGPTPPVPAPRPVSPSGRLPSPAPVPPRKCPHCTVLLLDRFHIDRHRSECAFAPTPCGATDPANPTIRCLFVGRGAASVEDHRRECPLRPISCPHQGCGATVAFASLMEHLEGPCQMQPLACHACGMEVPRGGMDGHSSVHCTHALVVCPLGCGHSFPRCDVSEHIREQWADPLHRTSVDPQVVPAEHPTAVIAALVAQLHAERERALLDRLVSASDEAAFDGPDATAAASALSSACDRICACANLSAVCGAATLRGLATAMDARVLRVTQALRQTGDAGNVATGLDRRWALASLALHEAGHSSPPRTH